MTVLLTYTADGGERELAVVERPDAPGRLMLIDAPRRVARTDDLHIVDDELTTLAEARIVASGWAAEHVDRGQAGISPTLSAPRSRTAGPERELARYTTQTGQRVLVGQRIGGTVCVTDRPAAGADGTVLLIQLDVATRAELDALIGDYVAESERRGEPARRAPSTLAADLTRALVA